LERSQKFKEFARASFTVTFWLRVQHRLPGVEVSPQMFWHHRTDADPLQIWLRATIRDIATGNFDVDSA
jgi:hypothetical protein